MSGMNWSRVALESKRGARPREARPAVRPLLAKYEGTCPRCSGPIAIGDHIAKNAPDMRRLRHASCPEVAP